ncbi:MAG: hypothetical protein HFH03_06920 [Dorea sp.]|nr:hypothetical protein [Dorea sp.]
MSGRKTGVRNLFFVCGYCGKGLRYSGRKKEKYLCRSRTQEAENDCQKVEVSRAELEGAVLEQVRVMADMLMEERAVRREVRKGDRAAELEGRIADCAKETARWKGMKMRLYERYRAGEISREDYVERIETGRAWMEELERVMCEAQAELDRAREVFGSEGVTDEELVGLSELEVFDKERLKVLIEKVVVYEADAVEIVWKVGNPFRGENSA